MGKNTKALGLRNEARRNAEAHALAVVIRDRARSNASGAHANKGTRRMRTRATAKTFALREW